MKHELDLYRPSDEHALRGFQAALSHREPDKTFRTALFKCDLLAQKAAIDLRDHLIHSGARVTMRNLL